MEAKPLSPRWQALEAAIYHNASRVFVRSHNVLQTLVTHYGLEPERVHCVYAGSNVKVALRPRSGERHDGKRILFVGLDWERKGGPTLLEAFRRIRPRHPGDADTLATHLDELLSDPQRRRRLGENGRALAQDRYSWDRVGQSHGTPHPTGPGGGSVRSRSFRPLRAAVARGVGSVALPKPIVTSSNVGA